MKVKNKDGKKVKVFVEVVKHGVGNCVLMSDLREATKEDVIHFINTKCDHSKMKEQLIYDDHSLWLYDFRYCVICGESLGTV